MMDRPTSNTNSRLEMFVSYLGGGGDSSGSGRILASGGFVITLVSAVGSFLAHGRLPEQMRIHWDLGMGPYFGPEFAPTLLMLGLFPVFIGGTAGVVNLVDALLRDNEEFVAMRKFYSVAMLGTLGVLLCCQIALIIANL